jgi:nitrite reductase (NADH) small subunit
VTRVSLCTLEELPVGLGRAFEVDGKPIAVFRTRDDQIHAIHGVCSHKGAPLADGMIAEGHVVCPYHAFRFDLCTGESAQIDRCDSIKAYKTEVTDGNVTLYL